MRAQAPPDMRVIETLVHAWLEVWVVCIRVILLFEAIPSLNWGLLMVMMGNISKRGLPSALYRPSQFNVICVHLLLFIFLIVSMLWHLTFRWTSFTPILSLGSRLAFLMVADRVLLLSWILRQISWNWIFIHVLLWNSFHVLCHQVPRIVMLDTRHILDFPHWLFASFWRFLHVLKAEVDERSPNLEEIGYTLRVSSLKNLHRVTNLN